MKISEDTVRNEKINSLSYQFRRWVDDVRLTGNERQEIEDIIRSFEELI